MDKDKELEINSFYENSVYRDIFYEC